MDLASGCIDRHVIKFCRCQEELLEWRDKCVESKCFSTPPNTNAIDIDELWDELTENPFLHQLNAYKCG